MIPTTDIEGRRRRRRGKVDDLEDCDGSSRRRLKAYSTCSSLMTSPAAGHIRVRRRASLEDLPEELLHKVVSGLSVKEAGRTSVLSSAWRQRWTYHANLSFDRNSPEFARYRYDDRSRLVDHVTTVLQRLVLDNTRRLSPPVVAVERFVFRSPVLGVDHAPQLDEWLGFAAAAKARHVTLDLTRLHPLEPGIVARQNHKYRLPADQLCSNGIESLLLGQVCLELPVPPAADGVGGLFRNLKMLELKFIDDRLGYLTTFLSNCHALEWLHIRDSRLSDHTLVVPQQAHCLRYLSLIETLLKTIQLNVTSLTRFEYRGGPPIIKTNGDACLKQLSLVNLAICTGSQLDPVRCFWDQQVSASLSNVDHLVLAFININLKTTTLFNNRTEFVNLRQLTLTCNIVERYPYPEGNASVFLRLTQFLESAPQLEHFELQYTKNLTWPRSWKTTDDGIVPHVHRRLKTVSMSGMIGLSGQLELARYILLSAHALESMTLRLRNPDWVYSKPTDATRFHEFAKKYLDRQGLYRQVLKFDVDGFLLE